MPEQRVIVFCEAEADFQAARLLIERTVPQAQFEWLGLGDRQFVKWTELKQHFDRLPLRVRRRTHGKGSGEGKQARKALILVRLLRLSVDAIVMMRDADGCDRRPLMERSVLEAQERATTAGAPVVLGIPIEELEAWYLVGFEPRDADERAWLKTEARKIGRDPIGLAHTLNPKREHHAASTKRVLNALTAGSQDRQRACLSDTSLASLKSRGGPTGLTAFLTEVEAVFAPSA